MIRLITLSLLFLTLSCGKIRQFAESPAKALESNVIKRYYDNGRLRSSYKVNDLKQKHGEAKFYSKKGVIKKSFIYENDEKIQAIQYYDNGQPLLEINYKNDVKDGPFRRYYDNGQMESEIIYRDNYPGSGLKEYSKSGKLRTHYPNLIVEGIDKLQTEGSYIIQVYFDDQPGRGTYYLGELTDGTFMNYSLDKLQESNYRGQFILHPPPGAMIMEKLTFVGEFKTPTGNKYIVTKDFNLAIDNSF